MRSRAGIKCSKSLSTVTLSYQLCCLLQRCHNLQEQPEAGDMFKHVSLWGTFHIQTLTVPWDEVLETAASDNQEVEWWTQEIEWETSFDESRVLIGMLRKFWKCMAVIFAQLCGLIASDCFMHFEIIKTASKSKGCQPWWPEFDPWILQGRRRELSPACCLPTSHM